MNHTTLQERAAHDEWREEKKALRESVHQLNLDLAELKQRVAKDCLTEGCAGETPESTGRFIRYYFQHRY